MASDLNPDPWEYPAEIKHLQGRTFTEDEFFDAFEEFVETFNIPISMGFGIHQEATPVLRYAITHNKPRFYLDWTDQIYERAALHGIVF